MIVHEIDIESVVAMTCEVASFIPASSCSWTLSFILSVNMESIQITTKQLNMNEILIDQALTLASIFFLVVTCKNSQSTSLGSGAYSQ